LVYDLTIKSESRLKTQDAKTSGYETRHK
jgi:hypothetical protein